MRVVATAGHVDHGKSTLLRALTGMEPDRWEEEQRRGLTIDLGFVWAALDTDAGALTVAFVDVPGHERFIANMLAGAGAVPLALFVVAADDGWSAQSQEHLDILHLLGVPAAVVAVTKADLAGDERAGQVADDVARRLKATSLEGAPVVVVDSVSGRGVDELRVTLAARLAAAAAVEDRGRPRLWVDRSFTVAGAGTVVTGTLSGGSLEVGAEVGLLPAGRTARVRGLQELGRAVQVAAPGSRVAVNLAGLARDAVGRGDALVGLAGGDGRGALAAWRATATLDAWVTALPGAEVGARGAWHLHVGSAEAVATLHPVLGEAAVDSRPAHIRIRVDPPLPLVSGDRFVLREAGRRATLGGGEVLDPDPPGRVRGPEARLERADALDAVLAADSPAGRLAALLASSGGARTTARARAAAGVHPAEPLPPDVAEIAGHLVTRSRLEQWRDAVVAAVRADHAANPQGRGATREVLTGVARQAGAPRPLAAGLVDSLAADGTLRRDGSWYALPEHVPARDEAKQRRRAEFLRLLTDEPFAPPPLEEATRRAGLAHEELTALVHDGEVVLSGGVGFSRDAVDLAVRRLARLEEELGRFTTAQAREALGTSRKYAIPLLEHLDAVGVTDFDGQTRAVRRRA